MDNQQLTEHFRTLQFGITLALAFTIYYKRRTDRQIGEPTERPVLFRLRKLLNARRDFAYYLDEYYATTARNKRSRPVQSRLAV